jgi:uncharacterized BrkB/YihY/UPF0761 family membrane protein
MGRTVIKPEIGERLLRVKQGANKIIYHRPHWLGAKLMNNQQSDWLIIAIILLIFGGMGLATILYTDQIIDWYIRIIRSRWNKIGLRIVGFLMVAFSIFGAAILLFSKP